MNPLSLLLKKSSTDLTDIECEYEYESECPLEYSSKAEENPISPDTFHQKEAVICCDDSEDSGDSVADIADFDDEMDDDMDIFEIFENLSELSEDLIFAENGYEKISKICDTLQGELFKAKNTENDAFVAIKKVSKQLTSDQIAERDGFTFSVTENVVKEAIILKYLTHDNRMLGNYVVQYIDFFESDTHFYLVTEYCNGIRLDQFIKTAFQYIHSGKLSLKTYQKLAKFILWQLSTTLRFLHDVHHCCHLDLCLENIILQNAQFIENMDGSISIPTTINIKLLDFGVSEMFDSNNFQCYKHNLNIDNEGYLAPKVFDNESYDARAADMWSLGMIFYQIMTGQQLYTPSDMGLVKKNGYLAVHNKKLRHYVKDNNLAKFFQIRHALPLLCSLLNVRQSHRITALDCIEHDYFKSYLNMYRSKINKFSKIQRALQQSNELNLADFSYYKE